MYLGMCITVSSENATGGYWDESFDDVRGGWFAHH